MLWLCYTNVPGICRRKLRGRDKEREMGGKGKRQERKEGEGRRERQEKEHGIGGEMR